MLRLTYVFYFVLQCVAALLVASGEQAETITFPTELTSVDTCLLNIEIVQTHFFFIVELCIRDTEFYGIVLLFNK